MKEKLIDLNKRLIQIKRKNDENGYMLINVSESLKNDGIHYSREEFDKMVVPNNMAVYTVLKYFEKQLQYQEKLKYTTSDKVDFQIGIEVVTKSKTYEPEKKKYYKYENMVVITPYAFANLGPKTDAIYLEDVNIPKEERVKIPHIAVNYEDFFKEMKSYGYDFGASTFDDLLTTFKNSEYTYDIHNDRILNPTLSIDAGKQKKLI